MDWTGPLPTEKARTEGSVISKAELLCRPGYGLYTDASRTLEVRGTGFNNVIEVMRRFDHLLPRDLARARVSP